MKMHVRSEANGTVENAVRRITDGTSTLLVQSRLSEKLWGEALECFGYFRNVQEKLANRNTFQKLQEAFLFPRADGSRRQEGHAQRQTSHHRRVECFDAGGVPSALGYARRDSLQCARGDSLQVDG